VTNGNFKKIPWTKVNDIGKFVPDHKEKFGNFNTNTTRQKKIQTPVFSKNWHKSPE
jgi:hypothetical protein